MLEALAVLRDFADLCEIRVELEGFFIDFDCFPQSFSS
jgi:hypothetical protein